MTYIALTAAVVGWYVAYLFYLRSEGFREEANVYRRLANRACHAITHGSRLSDEDHIAIHHARMVAADAMAAADAMRDDYRPDDNVVSLARRAPVTQFPRPRGAA